MTPKCDTDVPMTCQEPTLVTSKNILIAMTLDKMSTSTKRVVIDIFNSRATTRKVEDTTRSGMRILEKRRMPICSLSKRLHPAAFVSGSEAVVADATPYMFVTTPSVHSSGAHHKTCCS